MSKPLVKLEYAIICDDIRKEDSHKLILIGVYTGSIQLKKFPARMAIAAWLYGKADRAGETEIEVRYQLKFPKAKPAKIGLKGHIKVLSIDDGPEFSAPVIKVGIELPEPGELTLQYRLEGSGWRTLVTKQITLVPDASEPAQPP